jgi:hypothetical protein
MPDSKSAVAFLKRHGLIPAHAGPYPSFEAGALSVHTTPIQAPLPLPGYQIHLNGESKAPDRYRITTWPHPEDE